MNIEKGLLLRVNGWNMKYRAKNKRRAYILIELIMAMGISIVIGSITLSITIDMINNYYFITEKTIEYDKLDNAMLNIDSVINDNNILSITGNSKDYKILGDNIMVTYDNEYNNELDYKIVYLKGDRLTLKTKNNIGGYVSTNDNTLVNGVLDFQVTIKENLIYYIITMKNGEERIRCI